MQRVRQQSATTQPGKFQLMLQRSRRRRRRFVCSSQLRRRRRLRQQKVRREMQLKSFAVVAGDIKCHSPLPPPAYLAQLLFLPLTSAATAASAAASPLFACHKVLCAFLCPAHSEMPPPEENEQCECDSNRMPSLPETKNQANAEGGGNVKGGMSVGRLVALSLGGRSVAVKNLLLFLHFRS